MSRIVKHGDHVERERDHLWIIQEILLVRHQPYDLASEIAMPSASTVPQPRPRIEMCMSMVEKNLFDYGCGGKDFGMLNRPKRLPSSCLLRVTRVAMRALSNRARDSVGDTCIESRKKR